MAIDPKGVNIPITSTFDPSGTDAAKRELEEVKRDADAAASASSQGLGGQLDGTTRDGAQVEEIRRGTEAKAEARAATSDLTEAEMELAKAKAAAIQGAGEEALKHLEAARATKGYGESLRQVELATKAMLGIQLAQQLSSTVQAMKELAPAGSDWANSLTAVDSAMSSVTAGMNTFIATGNPHMAATAGIAAGIAGVVSAYKEMRDAQKIVESGNGSVQKSMVPLAQYHRELAQSIRQDAIDKLFKAESDAANRLIKDLESLNRVRAAQDQTAATLDKANPNLTNADRAGNEVQRQVEAQQREIAELKAKQATLENQRTTLVEAVNAAPDKSDIEQKLKEDLKALDTALEDNQRAIQEATEIGKAEITAKITETMGTVRDQTSSDLTKAGEELKDELQREVEAAGANASVAAKQALERATRVLADGQVTIEELDELKGIATQSMQSTEAVMNNSMSYFQSMLTWAEGQKRTWQSFDARMRALEERN